MLRKNCVSMKIMPALTAPGMISAQYVLTSPSVFRIWYFGIISTMPGIIIVDSMAAKTRFLAGKLSRAKAKPAREQVKRFRITMLAENTKLLRIQRGKYEFPFWSGSTFQTAA